VSGLAEFLNARLDEDEAAAREAGSGDWRAEPWYDGNFLPDSRPLRCDIWEHSQIHRITDTGGQVDVRDGTHIARHDPAPRAPRRSGQAAHPGDGHLLVGK